MACKVGGKPENCDVLKVKRENVARIGGDQLCQLCSRVTSDKTEHSTLDLARWRPCMTSSSVRGVRRGIVIYRKDRKTSMTEKNV